MKEKSKNNTNNILNNECCCVECEWEGKLHMTNMDTYYDQFTGIDNSFPVCPNCGGTIRVENN